jgi:hypothetical protein
MVSPILRRRAEFCHFGHAFTLSLRGVFSALKPEFGRTTIREIPEKSVNNLSPWESGEWRKKIGPIYDQSEICVAAHKRE